MRSMRCWRGNARTGVWIGVWVVATLLLGSFVLEVGSSARSGLFQSPPSDADTPPAEPSAPVPDETPVLTPTLTVTSTLDVTPTVPVPPTNEPVPSPEPVEQVAEPTAVPPTPAGVQETPTTEPAPTEPPVVDEPEGTPQRYVDDESTVRFEYGQLFDSVALGASYLWLCCGVLVLILIPVLFITLWIASRRRKSLAEEES